MRACAARNAELRHAVQRFTLREQKADGS